MRLRPQAARSSNSNFPDHETFTPLFISIMYGLNIFGERRSVRENRYRFIRRHEIIETFAPGIADIELHTPWCYGLHVDKWKLKIEKIKILEIDQLENKFIHLYSNAVIDDTLRPSLLFRMKMGAGGTVGAEEITVNRSFQINSIDFRFVQIFLVDDKGRVNLSDKDRIQITMAIERVTFNDCEEFLREQRCRACIDE